MKNRDILRSVNESINLIKYFQAHDVAIGFPAGLASPDIIAKATVHEFGTGSIPQRSFLRGTLIRKRAIVKDLITKGYTSAFSQRIKGEIALGRIGAQITNLIKEQFDTGGEGTWAPLAQRTIRRKTKSLANPNTTILVDTGEMRRVLTYQVRKAG